MNKLPKHNKKVRYNSVLQIVLDKHAWEDKYQLLENIIDGLIEEERERIIGEIKKFKIMQGSVIDKLEEKSERERVTNLLNENLEIGYRQACMDIINLIKDNE